MHSKVLLVIQISKGSICKLHLSALGSYSHHDHSIKRVKFSDTLVSDAEDLRIQIWTDISDDTRPDNSTDGTISRRIRALSQYIDGDETLSKTPCSRIYMFCHGLIYVLLITSHIKMDLISEGDGKSRHPVLNQLSLTPNIEKGYSSIPLRVIRPSSRQFAAWPLDNHDIRYVDQDTPKFTECQSITLEFYSKASKSTRLLGWNDS
jgi:hypothetical protein